ncbi:hypothetical protein C2E23DRAFT_360589 [Lenzites betulinus]|nr:hypothetical protein C2E23DRAFT_360589 [Lenzites betulinus]
MPVAAAFQVFCAFIECADPRTATAPALHRTYSNTVHIQSAISTTSMRARTSQDSTWAEHDAVNDVSRTLAATLSVPAANCYPSPVLDRLTDERLSTRAPHSLPSSGAYPTGADNDTPGHLCVV